MLIGKSVAPRAAGVRELNAMQRAVAHSREGMTASQLCHAVIAMCVITASIDVALSGLLYRSRTSLSSMALCFVATISTSGAVLAPTCWMVQRFTAQRRHTQAAVLHRLAIACVLVPCLPALREAMRLLLLSGLQFRSALVLMAALGLPLAASAAWRRWQRADFLPAWANQAVCATIAMCCMTRVAAHLNGTVIAAIAGALIGIAVAAWRLPAMTQGVQRRLARRPAVLPVVLLVLIVPQISGELWVPRRSAASVAPRLPVKAVILITVDTLRWDALGSADAPDRTERALANAEANRARSTTLTPHLDALVKSCIVFEQARACAPWTLPSCASLLTGVSPDVHGAMRPESRVPSALTTLAEHMRRAGYRTAAFGDNPFLRPQSNLHQGFERYEFYPRPCVSLVGGELLSRVLGDFKTDVTAGELTEMACQWLAENAGNPVFLWVHYFDPHAPYAPPMDYRPDRPAGSSIDPTLEYADDIRSGRFMPTLEERRYLEKLYEGEVRSVDQQVGRLLSRLRELDLDHDCLWVFTSDHGEEFWDHESFEHGHSLYDELVRVPLLYKLPQSGAAMGDLTARRIPDPVGLDAVVPTILDVCGVAAPAEQFTGASLRPLWSDAQSAPVQTPAYSTGLLYYENRSMVVFDGCKYICSATGRREQVFNLAGDPLERVDLSLSRPDLIERGRGLLNSHADRTARLKDTLHVGDGETVALDDDTRRRLKSLGYID